MNIDIKYIYAGVGFVILLLFILHTRRSSYSLKNGIFNLAEFKSLPKELKTEFSNAIIRMSDVIKVQWNNASQQDRNNAILEIRNSVNNLSMMNPVQTKTTGANNLPMVNPVQKMPVYSGKTGSYGTSVGGMSSGII